MAEQQFGGMVALVTGGASGIGRACARLFAKVGASVIVSDVAIEGGEETVRLIERAVVASAFAGRRIRRRSRIGGKLPGLPEG